AIQDVDLPFNIWKIQEPKLIEEELDELMRLECDLMRVLLLMRKNGTPIDTTIRDKNTAELEKRVKDTHQKLIDQVGRYFNFNSTQQLAMILDQFDIPYPMTDK